MSPNSETASYRSGASGTPPLANLPAQPLTSIANVLIVVGLVAFAFAITQGLAHAPGKRSWSTCCSGWGSRRGRGGIRRILSNPGTMGGPHALSAGRGVQRLPYPGVHPVLGSVLRPRTDLPLDSSSDPGQDDVAQRAIPVCSRRYRARRDDGLEPLIPSVSRGEEARKRAATSDNILMPPPNIRRLAPAVCISSRWFTRCSPSTW